MTNCSSCEGPSLPRKVVNFTKAGIRHIVNGLEHVPNDVEEARLFICKHCPFRGDENNMLVCTHKDCGCYIKQKITWSSEECPIRLWGKYIEDKDLDKNNDVNTP